MALNSRSLRARSSSSENNAENKDEKREAPLISPPNKIKKEDSYLKDIIAEMRKDRVWDADIDLGLKEPLTIKDVRKRLKKLLLQEENQKALSISQASAVTTGYIASAALVVGAFFCLSTPAAPAASLALPIGMSGLAAGITGCLIECSTLSSVRDYSTNLIVTEEALEKIDHLETYLLLQTSSSLSASPQSTFNSSFSPSPRRESESPPIPLSITTRKKSF